MDLDIAYWMFVLLFALLPAFFHFISVHNVAARQRLAVGALMSLPLLVVAVTFSREVTILLSAMCLVVLYYFDRNYIEVTENLTKELSYDLKQDWPFLPKDKRDRISLEKEAAELIQREKGFFSATEVYRLIAETYGKHAETREVFLKKEIGDWMKNGKGVEFVEKGKGRSQYYKFKQGGEKK